MDFGGGELSSMHRGVMQRQVLLRDGSIKAEIALEDASGMFGQIVVGQLLSSNQHLDRISRMVAINTEEELVVRMISFEMRLEVVVIVRFPETVLVESGTFEEFGSFLFVG